MNSEETDDTGKSIPLLFRLICEQARQKFKGRGILLSSINKEKQADLTENTLKSNFQNLSNFYHHWNN